MRSGFVGLAGRPNVGKSTLTNALAGAHVAIVSDKPQTTRQRALGVVHGDDFQIVLVDLPGFQKPFDALTRRMQSSVDTSLKDVDKMYEKIQREITSRYSLGYTSTDERMNGAWRAVDIRLKRPDLKGAKLRTRDGYFAPFKQ